MRRSNHTIGGVPLETPPPYWRAAAWGSESRLHQLAPYIGKLKSSIAGHLIDEFTEPGQTVLDPFCGSGTVPLECHLRGRSVIAADPSPYAIVLTRSKINPPATLDEALSRLDKVLREAATIPEPDLRKVPVWVRRFFHPRTLKEVLAFVFVVTEKKDDFLLACLLGILHHQRPGFLSFPSSHLVPYLRDRKYPRGEFPEMYSYRELRPRMEKKITRAMSNASSPQIGAPTLRSRILQAGIEDLRLTKSVDAIITSPPYMNALDYRRDNRLRLWLLDRSVKDYFPEPTEYRSAFKTIVDNFAKKALTKLRPGGKCVIVVGDQVRRKHLTSHPATFIVDAISTVAPDVRLVRAIEDEIPDVRRSRREARAAKSEIVLIMERRKA